MRPILFVLPQLSQAALWPLLLVIAALSSLVAWHAARNFASQTVASQVVASQVVSNRTTEAQSSTRLAEIAAPASSDSVSSAILTPLGVGLMLAFFAVIWSRNAITLHSYGLMLIIGFGVATWLSCREAARRGINPNVVLDLALPLLFVSVLFCRALYVLLNRAQFDSPAEIIRIWDGGLSFHGSLVAAPLVVWFYAKRNGLGFGQLTDCIAPNAFLGYAIGRIGCLLNGCCYGGVCDLPWAMRFPDEHNRSILTPLSHPAQLYSSLMALGLFFLMQRLKDKPKWNRFSGQLTLLFFALYAIERFIMEIFRSGATANPMFGVAWLTQAQFASVIALVFIAIFWTTLLRKSSTRTRLQPPASNI